ncbi:cyclase dehydrase [Microvirga sp. 17 mud 1-3]|uniref:cyclase dehydrase n=1 Tax=Microvirga sp. 17 mud 1-3 TaxID=2082949 RepID=UPI000D6C7BBD|nr:cyclase dehydrase [Microvirga sp. 17 mud 1-3]AWM88179.1 cyclase dehydrase [Microvirga sp. 17 mud 1-3]
MAQHRYDRSRRRSPASAETMARGLGWFSLALGAAEVLGARSMARWLGMEDHERLIRAYGMREIATGIGILSQRDPTPWIWGRVAGDALDLATLGNALRDPRAHRDRVAVAFGAVAGATVLDVACANALTGQETQPRGRAVDYSDRSGLPQPPQRMRGAARDFQAPRDMRIPDALRPYKQPQSPGRPMPSM